MFAQQSNLQAYSNASLRPIKQVIALLIIIDGNGTLV